MKVRFALLVFCVIVMLVPYISSVSAYTLSQSTYNVAAQLKLIYWGHGERFNSWPASTITEITVLLYRVSTPTGTLYCRVRSVSDNSIIGTLGSIDVSTLGTGVGWYRFNSASAIVGLPQDVRIQVEYSDGTSTKYVETAIKNSNVYSDGVYTALSSGGSYTDSATSEFAWKNLTWSTPAGPVNVSTVDAVGKATVSTCDNVSWSVVVTLDQIN